MPPAVIPAAPPAAAKLDLKNDRRSRSSVSLNLRWCNSNSGQFLSSPAHIGSLLFERAFYRHLIRSQFIGTVKPRASFNVSVAARMSRHRLTKTKGYATLAYCLSNARSNFEKHEHCFSAMNSWGR